MKVDELIEDISILAKKGKKITSLDIIAIKPLKNNPLTPFLLNKFEKNGKLKIRQLLAQIQEFVHGNDLREKLRFIFSMYDSKNDGVLTNSELMRIVAAVSEKDVELFKIQNLVDKAFFGLGEYKTSMDFDEFYEIVKTRNKNIFEFYKCIDFYGLKNKSKY